LLTPPWRKARLVANSPRSVLLQAVDEPEIVRTGLKERIKGGPGGPRGSWPLGPP